jgi:hypothetical protein
MIDHFDDVAPRNPIITHVITERTKKLGDEFLVSNRMCDNSQISVVVEAM